MTAGRDVQEPIVRIARVTARQGQRTDLIRAAHGNTRDALAAGALTAEVCTDPTDDDVIVVISRWPSIATLEDFLGWHEQLAHESMADYSEGKPTAAHHRVLGAETGNENASAPR